MIDQQPVPTPEPPAPYDPVPRAGDIPCPELSLPHKPRMEVRVGGRALVAVHHVKAPGYWRSGFDARYWAVIATDLDGNYLTTLAQGRGEPDHVPDPVLDECLRTAGQLYGHDTRTATS